MTASTLVHPTGSGSDGEPPAGQRPVTEWLPAMGSVLHRLDYGGGIAAVGCADATAAARLAVAYPLATVDVIDADRAALAAAKAAIDRVGASARCELQVGGPDELAGGAYDLVCFLQGLAERDDPVGWARAAVRSVRPTGAVMVLEGTRADAFFDGPVVVGGWLVRAGAARVRLAAATTRGFVLDARSGL